MVYEISEKSKSIDSEMKENNLVKFSLDRSSSEEGNTDSTKNTENKINTINDKSLPTSLSDCFNKKRAINKNSNKNKHTEKIENSSDYYSIWNIKGKRSILLHTCSLEDKMKNNLKSIL